MKITKKITTLFGQNFHTDSVIQAEKPNLLHRWCYLTPHLIVRSALKTETKLQLLWFSSLSVLSPFPVAFAKGNFCLQRNKCSVPKLHF